MAIAICLSTTKIQLNCFVGYRRKMKHDSCVMQGREYVQCFKLSGFVGIVRHSTSPRYPLVTVQAGN